MNNPSSVLPFYFDSAGKQLYGCYHAPRTKERRSCGVVISQPMGHEYIYCHRALRQLATRLAEVGFPVLRFDFYGCGDSHGDLENAEFSQWQNDISSAITELRSRVGISQICLIGVRLGAALSFITAAKDDGIEAVVLWDPVVLGKLYLEELRLLQREVVHSRRRSFLREPTGGEEVIGFPLSEVLGNDIAKVNLLNSAPTAKARMLAVQCSQSAEYTSFKDRLTQCGIRFEHKEIQAPKVWLPTVDGSLLVPAQILRSVVSWTCSAQA